MQNMAVRSRSFRHSSKVYKAVPTAVQQISLPRLTNADSTQKESIEGWYQNFRAGYGVHFLKPNGEWGYGKFVKWTSPLRRRAVLEKSGTPRGEEVYFNKKVVPTPEGMKMFRFN